MLTFTTTVTKEVHDGVPDELVLVLVALLARRAAVEDGKRLPLTDTEPLSKEGSQAAERTEVANPTWLRWHRGRT